MHVGFQVTIDVVEDTPDFVALVFWGGAERCTLRVSRGLSREQAEVRIGMVVLSLLEGSTNKSEVWK
jgi:hypothetical protein